MKFKNIRKQYLTAEAVRAFQHHDGDVGSTEVQIATLTFRIKDLSRHMETNRKDFSSLRGLKKLSSSRKKLMKYLKNVSSVRYNAIAAKLSIK